MVESPKNRTAGFIRSLFLANCRNVRKCKRNAEEYNFTSLKFLKHCRIFYLDEIKGFFDAEKCHVGLVLIVKVLKINIF